MLNYIFILLFGYRAAAYTTAFSYLVLMCMQAYTENACFHSARASLCRV